MTLKTKKTKRRFFLLPYFWALLTPLWAQHQSVPIPILGRPICQRYHSQVDSEQRSEHSGGNKTVWVHLTILWNFVLMRKVNFMNHWFSIESWQAVLDRIVLAFALFFPTAGALASWGCSFANGCSWKRSASFFATWLHHARCVPYRANHIVKDSAEEEFC